MIFGNRLAVSGAREPELLLSVIDRVAEMATAQPAPQAGDDDS
jgi:predicted DsbA family dithiol-disulfide isomerase